MIRSCTRYFQSLEEESMIRSLPATCRHMLGIVRAVIREIFDESAYARFLDRSELAAGRESYAAFLHEAEATRKPRPRCC